MSLRCPRFGLGLPAVMAIALQIVNLVPARLRPTRINMCSKLAITNVNAVAHDGRIWAFV